MKKIIFLLALIVSISVRASAQDYAGRIKGPTVLANAAADTVEVTINQARSAITFKYDVTKNSGAVAGTIATQYKLTTVSGEQWFTHHTDTLTDATANYVIPLANNPAQYWRIITTTTGTQNSTHNKYLLYRK